jgi:hypothetical protein
MPTKYIAKLEGKIVGKRTTRDRTYTHAVVVQHADAEPVVATWCGRPDLAQKEAASRRRGTYYTNVWIVDAEVV